MVITHALSVGVANTSGSWIVDSGASCHVCNDKSQFANLSVLDKPIDNTIGDGFTLNAMKQWKYQKVYIS